jgi:hypothetical protein
LEVKSIDESRKSVGPETGTTNNDLPGDRWEHDNDDFTNVDLFFTTGDHLIRQGPDLGQKVNTFGFDNTGAGLAVTLCTDAAVAHLLAERDVDAVVVGADAVLPDGSVVNKTGTRAAALAAAREGVPCYAVAAADKVQTGEKPHLESGDPAAVYDGEGRVEAVNPTFDVTPADLVAGIVTDRGVLDADGVAAVAREHRVLTAWRDDRSW